MKINLKRLMYVFSFMFGLLGVFYNFQLFLIMSTVMNAAIGAFL